MKLSEMDSVTKLKTLGRLIPVLSRICEDQAIFEAFAAAKPRLEAAGNDKLQQWSAILSEVAPVLLDNHARDIVEIDMIMTGKSYEEVNAPGNSLYADFASFLDKDMADFFMQSGRTAKKKS